MTNQTQAIAEENVLTFDNFNPDDDPAECTSLVIGDGPYAEEWVQYGKCGNIEVHCRYLFTAEELHHEDWTLKTPEDYPFDADHATITMLDD